MTAPAARHAPAEVPVSVVIAARNESTNIASCIESAAWAREVIVVENDSTDDTVEVARRAGATVFSHPFTTIGGQRNAAIERAQCEWILVLDADERASVQLGEELRQVIATRAPHHAYRIRRRNFFLAREIRHGGWERDKPVRFFRAGLRYDESRVHEHVRTTEAVGELRTAVLHTPYASLDSYFEKFDRYSRWWAEDQFARGRRTSALAVVAKPPARFLQMYLLRGAFLDGAHGVILSALAAASVLAKYARLWALCTRGPAEA